MVGVAATVLLLAFVVVPFEPHSEITGASQDLPRIIRVGVDPLSLTLHPSGRYLYVANFGSDTVSVIDTTINEVVGTLPTEHFPRRIRLAPDGSAGFVVNGMGPISVIDTVTNEIFGTISWSGINVSDLAVHPDGIRLYLLHALMPQLSVIELAAPRDQTHITVSDAVVIDVAENFGNVVIARDGRRVYATSQFSNIVSVVDTIEERMVASFEIDANPTDLLMSADDHFLFITTASTNALHVVDTTTLEQMVQVPVGRSPMAMTMNQEGNRVYVANVDDVFLSVVDVARGVAVSSIEVGAGANDIELHPNGTLYISNAARDAVIVMPVP